MSDSNGFADHERVDLTKAPDVSAGHHTPPGPPASALGPDAPPDPAFPTVADLPAAGSEFWQPYDPYADPLSSLDPVHPAYPGAYPSPNAGPYPQPQYYANPYLMAPVRPRSNAMATGALISSLVAYPAMFFCFAGALIAPVSVVLGVIALGQLKERPYESGQSQAWSGIILGGLLTLLCLGLAAAWVALVF